MKIKTMAVLLSVCAFTIPTYAAKHVKKDSASHVSQSVKQVNINTANADKLTNSLKGIGKKRAQAIVEYREAHGRFKSVDELAKVKGFGQAFVKKNSQKLSEAFSIE